MVELVALVLAGCGRGAREYIQFSDIREKFGVRGVVILVGVGVGCCGCVRRSTLKTSRGLEIIGAKTIRRAIRTWASWRNNNPCQNEWIIARCDSWRTSRLRTNLQLSLHLVYIALVIRLCFEFVNKLGLGDGL
jgi:hypothetical protein